MSEEEKKVIHLGSDEQFAELTGSGVAVVDFYADWCGPCKILGPVMEELATDFDGSVNVIKVNVDDFGAIAGEYGVSSIPTVVVFKDGEQVGENLIGAFPKDHYAGVLNGLVGGEE